MDEVVGNIEVVATINSKGYYAGKKAIEKGNAELEGSADKTSKGFSSAWTGAIAGVALALTNKFIGAVTSSIDGAIKRVDTLNNATRTFENMGISAVDSSDAMKALQKSIKGLPTPLDGAVRGMTALTATYGDVRKGEKVFSALNNAILGFGGSSAMVDNAITQLSQLPMDGPLDAQTWNSLRNSGITPVLVAMAKDSGMSVAQMKEAFGKGELTVQDFTDRLVKLNADGGGGLKSLEKIAKDSTKGIGTGMDNMRTAITRGAAEVIKSFGSANISGIITKIGDAFETALKGVASMVNFVKKNSAVFTQLAIVVASAGVAMVAYTGYMKVASIATAAAEVVTKLLTIAMAMQTQGVGVARTAWMLFNGVLAANPIGLVVAAIGGLISILTLATLQSNNSKTSTDRLTQARKDLKTATDSQKLAEDNLRNAQLTAEGASLAVERAQRTYNETVKQYGPKSLEAREAALSLKRAYDDQKTAAENLKNETNNVINANKEVAKQKDNVNGAVQSMGNTASTAAGGYKNLADQISRANEQARKNDWKGVSQTITATPWSKGFATGGFTGRGGVNQPAGIVHAGEYVIPKRYVNQKTGLPDWNKMGAFEDVSNTTSSYNIGTINLASDVDADRFLRRLTNDQEIVSSGLVPQQSYMGAN